MEIESPLKARKVTTEKNSEEENKSSSDLVLSSLKSKSEVVIGRYEESVTKAEPEPESMMKDE
jgi:hypothetical protein